MREIKFRAWDGEKMWYIPELAEIEFNIDGSLEVCVWCKDDELHHSYGRPTKIGCTHENCNLKEFLGTIYVMQFTGLKDKNEKEIYEGDIVTDHKQNKGGDNRTISWDTKNAGWFPFSQCSDPYIGLECGNELRVEDCEIIGNIYENPELLDLNKDGERL